MCYAKPGPRCSPHAKAALDKAKAGGDKVAIAAAQDLYDTTPDGQKELRAEAEKSEKAGDRETTVALRNRAIAGVERKQEQIDAYNAAYPDKAKGSKKAAKPVAAKPAAPVNVTPQIPASLMALPQPPAHGEAQDEERAKALVDYMNENYSEQELMENYGNPDGDVRQYFAEVTRNGSEVRVSGWIDYDDDDAEDGIRTERFRDLITEPHAFGPIAEPVGQSDPSAHFEHPAWVTATEDQRAKLADQSTDPQQLERLTAYAGESNLAHRLAKNDHLPATGVRRILANEDVRSETKNYLLHHPNFDDAALQQLIAEEPELTRKNLTRFRNNEPERYTRVKELLLTKYPVLSGYTNNEYAFVDAADDVLKGGDPRFPPTN